MSEVDANLDSNPNPNEMEKRIFTDFTIVNETWDSYTLEDGSVLRARAFLTGLMLDSKIDDIEALLRSQNKPKLGMTFRTKQIYEVEPPLELRATPDTKKYSNEELKACISVADIDFQTTKQSWNVYELKNGIKLKLRLSIVTISKTNKFDERGMPIYVIDSSIEIKTELPEVLKNILTEKKANIVKESPTFKPIS